jgi:hypothetical protein
MLSAAKHLGGLQVEGEERTTAEILRPDKSGLKMTASH